MQQHSQSLQRAAAVAGPSGVAFGSDSSFWQRGFGLVAAGFGLGHGQGPAGGPMMVKVAGIKQPMFSRDMLLVGVA
jgi:hypothetical protein